jgi:hypothetical protein
VAVFFSPDFFFREPFAEADPAGSFFVGVFFRWGRLARAGIVGS